MLPSRVAIRSDEALDCYLERMAAANGLATSQLMHLLTAPGACRPSSSTFMMFRPDPDLIDSIVRLGGVSSSALTNATLMRYDGGLPLQLADLDPRRRHSFRQVVAQGWFPQVGSQVCPQCLAHDGIWRVDWRLPIMAVCGVHQAFLVSRCTGCGMRFRTRRHSPLRPQLAPFEPCGNPMGFRNPCQHAVTAHSPEPAPASIVEMTRIVTRAIAGQPTVLLGAPVDPGIYLAELRYLATLLLHLSSLPHAASFVDWAGDLHDEFDIRAAPVRGPRWGFSPPQSATVRGRVLREANGILGAKGFEEAGARLAPWLSLIDDQVVGPCGWLLNRTTRSATIERLVRTAVATRHHVGRRLSQVHDEWTLSPAAIPQLIDVDVYHKFFDGMLGGYEWTARSYVSLCMARTVTSAASWPEAAACLGLDPALGVRTARAASSRMRVSPAVLVDAVGQAARAMPADRDYRRRETRIRALSQEQSGWHETWRTSMVPARRRSSFRSAITWMWCEVAQGSIDTCPFWVSPAPRLAKVAYRAFRNGLPDAAQEALRTIVLANLGE